MRLNRISFLFILALGAANVFAQSLGQVRDARRDSIRAYQVQVVTLDRNPPREQQVPVQTPQEPRRTGFGMSGSSGGYSASGDSQSNQSNQTNDNMRRQQGRMTPEERRALRRQIDEAGHDIYSPRR